MSKHLSRVCAILTKARPLSQASKPANATFAGQAISSATGIVTVFRNVKTGLDEDPPHLDVQSEKASDYYYYDHDSRPDSMQLRTLRSQALPKRINLIVVFAGGGAQ
jgi:hypothetical protein